MTGIIVIGILSCRNLSHNLLHGPIGDVFSALNNLKEMYVFKQSALLTITLFFVQISFYGTS